MEENEPTKTILTIMFKRIAAEYEDAIAMLPLTKYRFVLHGPHFYHPTRVWCSSYLG